MINNPRPEKNTFHANVSNSINHDRENRGARGATVTISTKFPDRLLRKRLYLALVQPDSIPTEQFSPGSDSDGAFNAKCNHGGGRDKSERSSFPRTRSTRRNASIVFKSVAASAQRETRRAKEGERKSESGRGLRTLQGER